MFTHVEYARAEQHARHEAFVETARATRSATASRLQRRAARLTHRAERVSRRAERAAAQARVAVARAL